MKAVPTITVDMDKACSECGKEGACGNGLCMECAAKRIGGPVDIRLISKGMEDIREFLFSHMRQIGEAYLNSEDCLNISMGLKIMPTKDGRYQVETKVDFVLDRVKVKTTIKIDPKQRELKLK